MSPEFESWLNEMEGYSLRYERFVDAVYQANPELMKRWLWMAWQLGMKEGKTGNEYEQEPQ